MTLFVVTGWHTCKTANVKSKIALGSWPVPCLDGDMTRVLPFLLLMALSGSAVAERLQLGEKALAKVGQRIWQNECGGTVKGLTAWNSGEDFASIGIGHFIWYPKGKRGPFTESFPGLVSFLREHGVKNPAWLSPEMPCPWNTKKEFEAAADSEQMKQLRGMLKENLPLQTKYIVRRLEAALPTMLKAAPGGEREAIERRFYSLAGTPGGLYALIDYVNFKGEGTSPTERYQGQGWGLLQVLEGMQGEDVKAFAVSAKRVLTRRVENSPPERNEAKWLPGWKSRCDTYVTFE